MDKKTEKVLNSGSASQFKRLFASNRRKKIQNEDFELEIIDKQSPVKSHNNERTITGTNFGLYLIYCVQKVEESRVNISLLRWLVQKRSLKPIDIDTVDVFGRTALHYCVILGKQSFFSVIFDWCSTFTMTCKDSFGLSAFHYGILLNCFEVVESIAVQ